MGDTLGMHIVQCGKHLHEESLGHGFTERSKRNIIEKLATLYIFEGNASDIFFHVFIIYFMNTLLIVKNTYNVLLVKFLDIVDFFVKEVKSLSVVELIAKIKDFEGNSFALFVSS